MSFRHLVAKGAQVLSAGLPFTLKADILPIIRLLGRLISRGLCHL